MRLHESGVANSAAGLLKWISLIVILAGLAGAQQAPAPDQATAAPASAPKPAAAAGAASGVRSDSYVIGAEDVISVYVWKEPDMSKSVPVRPDGMISLPLVGEIRAAGYTPVQLEGVLAEAMKKVISDPQVTVVVEKIASLNFNIVGEVYKPGYYPLTRRLTVLDAIALAGGFKDFAKVKKVYVLRTSANGSEERLPFNYKDVIAGRNPQQNIELQPRDTIVVP